MAMNSLRRLLLAAIVVLCSVGSADARPRVGLVLGGGGARGAAHLGVLQVLKEKRIPVDCVAGTSMGALAAGAFAVGLDADEIVAELDKANWQDMFEDNPDYSNMNYRNKTISRAFLPGLEMGVSAKGVRSLPGVVDGEKIKLFFNQLVRANLGEQRIERLGLPLSIIATDIGTGEKVVFREGSLTKAMRASMSVPGLVAPLDYQGRKLVDGGLVDNLPVVEARDRCQADVLIAVNVGSPLLKAEEVGSLLTVAAQMVNILTEQNVAESLKQLHAADIYLQPDLAGIAAADFERFREAASRGREAALRVDDRLAALAVSPAEYDAWWKRVMQSRPDDNPVIDQIEITGQKRVPPDYVDRHITVRPGEPMDTAELEGNLLRMYGDGHFESVDYTLLRNRDKNILRVTPTEKTWGPDYLRFGLNLESAMNAESTYNLRAAYHRTWLNPLGGEWLTTVQVGNAPGISTDFYQPLDRRQRFFLQPSFSYASRTYNVHQNNRRIAQLDVREADLNLLGGVNVGLLGPVKFGWQERYRRNEIGIGMPMLSAESRRFGGWLTSIDFDQMDRLYAPTRGWSARGNYFSSAGEGYGRAELDLRGAYPVRDIVLLGRLYGAAATRGTLPGYDAASLGGFLNLSGFVKDQMLGDSALYGHMRAEKIVGHMPLGLRGDLRVGLALEAGRVDRRYTETQLQGWQRSTALYLGGETPLGMMYLGLGHAPNGMTNVFVFVGTP